MNKYDRAEARRTLLEHWLRTIEEAEKARREEILAMLAASNGEPITPPPLRMFNPSDDMIKLLLGGIRNALDGRNDPFETALPPRGKKPKHNHQGRLDIVREVIGEVERNKERIELNGSLPFGKRDPVTEAIATVADRHQIPCETVKKAYYSKYKWLAFLQGPIFIADD